jgi:hypothetical protein
MYDVQLSMSSTELVCTAPDSSSPNFSSNHTTAANKELTNESLAELDLVKRRLQGIEMSSSTTLTCGTCADDCIIDIIF